MQRIRLEDAEIDQVVLVLDDSDKDAYMQLALVLELPDKEPAPHGLMSVGCKVKLLTTGAEIFLFRGTKVLSRKRRKYLSRAAGKPDRDVCFASFHNVEQAEIARSILTSVGFSSSRVRSRMFDLMNVVIVVDVSSARIDDVIVALEPWFSVRKAVLA